MDRVRIKERAKLLLKKNQGACIAVAFLATLLGGTTSGGSISFSFSSSGGNFSTLFAYGDVPVGVIIAILVFLVLAIAASFAISAFLGGQVKAGSCRYFLKYRKNHPVEIGEIFKSYSDKTFLNVAKVTFIKDIQIFLWSFGIIFCSCPTVSARGVNYRSIQLFVCGTKVNKEF